MVLSPRPLLALALLALALLTARASAQIGGAPPTHNAPVGLAAAGAPARQSSSWTTDNLLESMAQIGDTVYAGGMFGYAGPQTGALALYNPASGQVEAGPPRVRGQVYAIAPDGAGGFFIGGVFTQVGDLALKNLAHIRADMSLDSAWRPEANSGVYSLARAGERLYIGGDFTTLGGAARARLAAVSTTDGALLDWNPGADSRVETLLVAGGRVYAAGGFANAGGVARAGLAALDLDSGTALAWDAQLSAERGGLAHVWVLASTAETLYIGGGFAAAGGAARSNLAAFDLASGALRPWAPAPNDRVENLGSVGDTLYLVGAFDQIDGQARNRLAAFGADGSLLPFNPLAGRSIYLWGLNELTIMGDTLYLEEDLPYMHGSLFQLLALDLSDGSLVAGPLASELPIRSLLPLGEKLLLGGEFYSAGGARHTNLAAFDAATGALRPWTAPEGIAWVSQLVAAGDRLIVMHGEYMSGPVKVAVIDPSTGSTLWSINADMNNYMAVAGETLYIGGGFDQIAGTDRNALAAFDIASGAIKPWAPALEADSSVEHLAVFGDTVYVTGPLRYSYAGEARSLLAAIDAQSGAFRDWHPTLATSQPRAPVISDLIVAGDTLYMAGSFEQINAQPRPLVAAFDAATGALRDWALQGQPTHWRLAADAERLYLSGQPAPEGATTVGVFDRATGARIDWMSGEAENYGHIFSSGQMLFLFASSDSMPFGAMAGFALSAQALPELSERAYLPLLQQ